MQLGYVESCRASLVAYVCCPAQGVCVQLRLPVCWDTKILRFLSSSVCKDLV